MTAFFFSHVHRQETTQTYRLQRVKSRMHFYSEHFTPSSRLNLVTSWVLYFSPRSVPILLAGIHKQHQCKVSCPGTQYSSYSCKAVTHSESDQAQRCLPSLTKVNTHARSTP